MELYSMLCGNLDGSGVWVRMDAYICMAESLCCSPEAITILLIGYSPIQNKILKKEIKILSRRKYTCVKQRVQSEKRRQITLYNMLSENY